MSFKAQAMVQSTNTEQEITVHEKIGNNDYVVTTKDGIKCHAIFNFFTGLYYADDVYTRIEEVESHV